MIYNATKPLLFIALTILGFQSAYASNGGCPAGETGPATQKAVTEQKGNVEVYTESELPLDNETINAKGWRFRARSVAIAPGAIIPLHSHNDRPETVMMKHGELVIYETDCKVGYKMKEGEVYQSGHGKSHWAVNESGHYSVMYVVDLVKEDSFPVKSTN